VFVFAASSAVFQIQIARVFLPACRRWAWAENAGAVAADGSAAHAAAGLRVGIRDSPEKSERRYANHSCPR